eukprot:4614388-Alexandrium_andersonii.AAC.1
MPIRPLPIRGHPRAPVYPLRAPSPGGLSLPWRLDCPSSAPETAYSGRLADPEGQPRGCGSRWDRRA